jgi:hypothetical protein
LAPAAGEGVAVVAVGDTDRPVVGGADMPAVGVCPRAVAGQGMWQGSTARLQGCMPRQPDRRQARSRQSPPSQSKARS